MKRRSFIKGALALGAYLILPKQEVLAGSLIEKSHKLFSEEIKTGIIIGKRFYFDSPVTLENFKDLTFAECEFIFNIDGHDFTDGYCMSFLDCTRLTLTGCRFDASRNLDVKHILYLDSSDIVVIWSHFIGNLDCATTSFYHQDNVITANLMQELLK